MSFWIAAWVFVFALAMCLAALFGAEDWRESLPMAGLMLAAMAAAGYVMSTA